MEFNKITQKTECESIKEEAHVLITQPELINGESTEALRRASLPLFVNAALETAGFSIVDGCLCAIIEE